MTWLTPWNSKGAEFLGVEATFLTLLKLSTKLSCFRSEQLLKYFEHLNSTFLPFGDLQLDSGPY